jgi:excisionase family DNA binding protein
MDYLTAAEAAERWGVSQRQVQRLLSDGRVQGARQFGTRYLIPADAEKPEDLRRKRDAQPPNRLFDDFVDVINATYVLWPDDDPDRAAGLVRGERLRVLPEMSIAYLRGGFEQIIRSYDDIEESGSVKLCAAHVAIAAAINLGDYSLFMHIESYLRRVATDENVSPAVAAYAELGLASAYVSAAALDMTPAWFKDGDFSALPWVVRQAASFVRVRFFQWKKNYEAMLATAQTAIGMGTSPPGVSFFDAYLLQLCAAACYALGRIGDAEAYLRDAMATGLRYGFVTPLADGVHACGGLIEKLLKRDYPEYFDAVVGQARRAIPNWIAFHNLFTKESISQILSIRDYQIALLAARGVPNKKIAEHFSISQGTLNNRMQVIYELLFISGKSPKKELAKYVF